MIKMIKTGWKWSFSSSTQFSWVIFQVKMLWRVGILGVQNYWGKGCIFQFQNFSSPFAERVSKVLVFVQYQKAGDVYTYRVWSFISVWRIEAYSNPKGNEWANIISLHILLRRCVQFHRRWWCSTSSWKCSKNFPFSLVWSGKWNEKTFVGLSFPFFLCSNCC